MSVPASGSSGPSGSPPARRSRLSPDERRRQLVAIGLARLVETPIQDLSLDEVATEAGISRGLLFHYFPTKRDFYLACIEAAGRRVLRTTLADPALPGPEQVRVMVDRLADRIDRRRAFYLSLLRGTGGSGDARAASAYEGIRTGLAEAVAGALDLPEEALPVVHAWWAYVEDRAVRWSADPPARRTVDRPALVAHCVDALDALLGLGEADRVGGRGVPADMLGAHAVAEEESP